MGTGKGELGRCAAAASTGIDWIHIVLHIQCLLQYRKYRYVKYSSSQNVIQYFISVGEIKHLQGGKRRKLRTVLYENTQRSPKN